MTANWLLHPNQNCWNCGSFQRYDTAKSDLTKAFGDCHAKSISDQWSADDFYNDFFPVIPDGRYHWCGEWKKSDLPVPAEPINPTPIDWPIDWFVGEIWNVRSPQNISCWTCNHFQPIDNDDIGTCRNNCPPRVVEQLIVQPDSEKSIMRVEDDSSILLGDEIGYFGSIYWCSQWEFLEGSVRPPINPPVRMTGIEMIEAQNPVKAASIRMELIKRELLKRIK